MTYHRTAQAGDVLGAWREDAPPSTLEVRALGEGKLGTFHNGEQVGEFQFAPGEHVRLIAWCGEGDERVEVVVYEGPCP